MSATKPRRDINLADCECEPRVEWQEEGMCTREGWAIACNLRAPDGAILPLHVRVWRTRAGYAAELESDQTPYPAGKGICWKIRRAAIKGLAFWRGD